jgi:hypothetical protein
MPSRRDLITGGARLAAGRGGRKPVYSSIRRALSIPANQRRLGQDVHHVVIPDDGRDRGLTITSAP